MITTGDAFVIHSESVVLLNIESIQISNLTVYVGLLSEYNVVFSMCQHVCSIIE